MFRMTKAKGVFDVDRLETNVRRLEYYSELVDLGED
jgi:hypothetical protein